MAGPIVAIVGRPNVGKSRLFNRLVRKRRSIVHDLPGVTRDVVAEDCDGYTLLDTGGIGLTGGETPREIVRATERQAEFAIGAAQVVVFVVDAREGVTPLDLEVAALLRRAPSVILVANKVDPGFEDAVLHEFRRLGFGMPLAVSAEHGIGEDALRTAIAAAAGVAAERGEDTATARPLKLAIVGRPNVGKSSLGNHLLNEERLIVSDVPGTTRDAVELDCTWNGRGGPWRFTLVDTAGLRHATKVASPVELFSRLRTLDAIAEADLLILLVDAMAGITKMDKEVAGAILERRRPMVVGVNKWDLVVKEFRANDVAGYKNESEYRKAFAEAVGEQLFFTPGSPVVFLSALTGSGVDQLLRAARGVEKRLDLELPTARLNQLMIKLADANPPPRIGGIRFRIYYVVQTGSRPYRIRVFCNQARRLTETYRRYLEGGLMEEFGLEGCPVLFDLVGKKEKKTASTP